MKQVEFVTLKEYLDKYGPQMKETVYLPMDAWNKSLTWGLGGDQIRILDRKVDALLLAAELFDAVAAGLGRPSQADTLEKAWRDLLASQSHDVGLCEYSRWQGDRMAPFDRIEDKHNFTWGAIGYDHIDAANRQGTAVLDGALRHLSGRINTLANRQGDIAAVVFNPHAWPRTDLVTTGRIHPVPGRSRGVAVKDKTGRMVPSQMVKSSDGSDGNLTMADVAFLAQEVPGAGYDTYYLQVLPQAAPRVETDLRVDKARLAMENEFVRVRLDPKTGGVASLVAKPSGEEMLDAAGGAYPRFTGKPTPKLSTYPNPPAYYDSGESKAQIDWLAEGPLWGTLRAQHAWRFLTFETRVTLAARSPYVEVVSRVLARVPPLADTSPPDIKEGYWVSFVPGFNATRVLRDFPFGVEETKNPSFHALTFTDLVGGGSGLLILHAGTQYFKREASGRIANLVMREWESYYSKEFGWPIYAEYRHGLMPHRGSFENADRLRAAAAFARPMACALQEPRRGDLPQSKGFLSVSSPGIEIAAFRRKLEGGYELRVVETEGRRSDASVAIRLPVSRASETDLLGNRLVDAKLQNRELAVGADPWKIITFHLE